MKKIYGSYKLETCPFCNKTGVTRSSQGLSVCTTHKDKIIENAKCACGSYLEAKKGKFGAFFHCMNCGNINVKKVLELNPHLFPSKQE